MRKIIIFTGQADDVFLINEEAYLKKHFDKIIVIAHSYKKKNYIQLAAKRNVICYIIKNRPLSIEFIKWLFSNPTLVELKASFNFSKQGILKFLYILYYGMFYVNSKKYVDAEIKNAFEEDSVYLYSYWLSRGAYSISNYNINRDYKIKKIISRAHGYDLYEERNPTRYLPFRNFIASNLDEIHFISDHGLNYFKNKYKFSNVNSKEHISRLGTFNTNELRKNVYDKNKICIASCSSIIDVKRLDLIIDIVANLNLNLKWIHIGDGKLYNEMKKKAEEKLKNKEYEFLGYVENKEILSTYINYDVDFFINMSDSEGVPVSIMEAISLGIPVIARDVGGISELVDENTGLLIKNVNNIAQVSNEISTEIEKRIIDVDYYRIKHKECINKWKEKFDAEVNYENFFSDLI